MGDVKRKKKEVYNVIEIGNMTLVSKEGSMTELYKVANKILRKHKNLIQKKDDMDMPMPLDMFG